MCGRKRSRWRRAQRAFSRVDQDSRGKMERSLLTGALNSTLVSNDCSVFQAEVAVIKVAVDVLHFTPIAELLYRP